MQNGMQQPNQGINKKKPNKKRLPHAIHGKVPFFLTILVTTLD